MRSKFADVLAYFGEVNGARCSPSLSLGRDSGVDARSFLRRPSLSARDLDVWIPFFPRPTRFRSLQVEGQGPRALSVAPPSDRVGRPHDDPVLLREPTSRSLGGARHQRRRSATRAGARGAATFCAPARTARSEFGRRVVERRGRGTLFAATAAGDARSPNSEAAHSAGRGTSSSEQLRLPRPRGRVDAAGKSTFGTRARAAWPARRCRAGGAGSRCSPGRRLRRGVARGRLEPRRRARAVELVELVRLEACVEISKRVSLAQNEVFWARSWTGDHLCSRSRGLTDRSPRIRSLWTMLNVS